jgi:glycosyltransferase 2 family protein
MTFPKMGWLVRVAASAAIVGILLTVVPLSALVAAISRVPPLLWLTVVGVFIVCQGLAAAKWRLLMPGSALPPMVAVLRAHFSGLLTNLGIPGTIGGDLVRAAVALKGMPNRAGIAVGSVVDRAIDFTAMATLVAVGVAWSGRPAVIHLHWPASKEILWAVALAGGAFVVYRLVRQRLQTTWVRLIVEAIESAWARPAPILPALVLSTAIQATFVVLNWELGRSVGVDVHLAVWLFAWPLAKLAGLLPIGIAGLGVREVTLIALLQPFGAPASSVLAEGLLWQAVLLVGGVAGWILSRHAPLPTTPRTPVPCE